MTENLDHDHGSHNHAICQKLKAENEIFLVTTRERFTKTLTAYKLPDDIHIQILEIIELILGEEYGTSLRSNDLGINSYCQEIASVNEFHKVQFFKVCYFLECLEKSRLSAVNLHRIRIFLETGIFRTLSIKEFFLEMSSVEVLYDCKMCGLMMAIDSDIDEISKSFYISVRGRCKECFRKECKDRYDMKMYKKKVEEIKAGKPMTKMYLCMKCGEDNYINFYERNKSKCKFCILAERRGVMSGSEIVGASASKSYHCKECHTEEPKNFRETYKSICYACFLVKKKEKYSAEKMNSVVGEVIDTENDSEFLKRKNYSCKDCETEDPGKFRRGYKSQCYECFLKEKNLKRNSKVEAENIIELELQNEVPNSKAVHILALAIEEEKKSRIAVKYLCKYCGTNEGRNFNEGMETVCARCEEIENESYICKKCNLECLRSAMNLEKGVCNLCDPDAFKPGERKKYKCSNCEETNPENFYSGFKSKCKLCVREEKRKLYEMKERMLKSFHCSECGTEQEKDFYVGHKSKCKDCM